MTTTGSISKPNAKHLSNSFPVVVQLNVLYNHSDSNIPPPIKPNGNRLKMYRTIHFIDFNLNFENQFFYATLPSMSKKWLRYFFKRAYRLTLRNDVFHSTNILRQLEKYFNFPEVIPAQAPSYASTQ